MNRSDLNGSIPGENMTSDTRNYAWHRPPDITNLDEAVEWSMNKLTSEKTGPRVISVVANGVPVTAVADTFVTLGISRGKWSPDFGLLLAGPVTRMIEMLAKGYEVDYELGLDDGEPIMTPEYLKGLSEDDLGEKTPEDLIEKVQNELNKTGFASQEDDNDKPSPIPNESKEEQSSGGFMAMMNGDNN